MSEQPEKKTPVDKPKVKFTRAYFTNEIAEANAALEKLERNKERLNGLIRHAEELLQIGLFEDDKP